jgi:hypothetical protein
VVAYRTKTRSATASLEWHNLRTGIRIVAPVVLLAAPILAGLAIWNARRRQWSVLAVLTGWVLLAGAGFLAGGQFYLHYWVILTFPFGVALASLTAALPTVPMRRLALAGILVLPALTTVLTTRKSFDREGSAVVMDPRLELNEEVRAWYREHHAPGDQMLALCSSPALYYDTLIPTPFTYLWPADIVNVPGAYDQLMGILEGPTPPRFVAEYMLDDKCDVPGRIKPLLQSRYRVVQQYDGQDDKQVHIWSLVEAG